MATHYTNLDTGYPIKLKAVFKKEDKKDQEVRGSVALSSGMYAFNT